MPRHSKYGRDFEHFGHGLERRAIAFPGTTRLYWFSTLALPSFIWRSSMTMDCRISSGSNPATTIGLPSLRAIHPYGRQPITVETWPGPMNASMRMSGRIENRADGGNDGDVVAEDGKIRECLRPWRASA